MDIKGKVIIVTGASSGIGLATARLFSQKGAMVALVARSADKLKMLEPEIPNSFAAPADMADRKAVIGMIKKVYDHYGRIDVLINDAGQGYDSPVEAIEPDKLQHIFNLSVMGPVIAMQQVIPIMRKLGCGAIINVSSGLARMDLPNQSPYASMKAGLAKISLAARQELEKDKIVVSVVYPYITRTEFEKNTLRSGGVQYQTDDEITKGLPKPDTAEFVAGKILETVESGIAEQVIDPWKRGKG